MEDNLIFIKLTMTFMFLKMEEDLNLFCKWKTTTFFWENGRQNQMFFENLTKINPN
jgi:hypothetical protein